jgi:hypothetical protein
LLLNLLPGLRELRASLAAGYIWLAGLWVLVGDSIPHERPTGGLLADVWSLSDAIGKTAILAGVTFIAYLVGSLLEVDPEGRWGSGVVEVMRTRMKRVKGRFGEKSTHSVKTVPLSFNGTQYITRYFIQNGWLKPRPWVTSWAASEELPDWLISRRFLVDEFVDEVPQLATRLQIRNPDLYGKYDRLLTEAALRMTIAAPASFLLIALAIRADLRLWQRLAVVGLGALIGLLLLWHGAGRNLAARDVLIQALTIGEVEWHRITVPDSDSAGPSSNQASEDIPQSGQPTSEEN